MPSSSSMFVFPHPESTLIRFPNRHLSWMPVRVFQASHTARWPDRPRALRGIISFGLPWSLLSFPAEELEQLATWRENWASLLRLLPPQTGPRYMTEDVCRYRWMDGVTYDIKYIKIWDECRGAKAKGEYQWANKNLFRIQLSILSQHQDPVRETL